MHRSELQQYGSEEPIWAFVAQLGAERFTGQAEVGVSPRVQLYATEGRVYLAEREGDPPIGARLVAMGALSAEQLTRGEVHLGDASSLARLFHRAPDVDRDVVEVALTTANDAVLETVANDAVGRVVLFPLRHHSSGVHQWSADLPPLPVHDDHDAAVVALVAAMQSVAEPEPELEPEPEPEPMLELAPEPEVAELPAEVEPVPPTLPVLGEVGSWVSPHALGQPVTPGVSQFDPTDLEHLDLPKLSSRPMSVGEITAAHAIVQAEKEAAAAEALLAESQQFESQQFESLVLPPRDSSSPVPPDHDTSGIPSFEAMLGSTETDWSAPSSPPAAQEIWEMVDEMLGLPHTDEQLVGMNGSSGHGDKKNRGWLRGRKG